MNNYLFICALLISQMGFSQKSDLHLWYDEPAESTWENALPIGNGFLGGMVFGNVTHEEIHLNETTVWSGSPNSNENPEALEALPEIRKLIFEGKQKEAETLANEHIISKKSHGQMFQPVGILNLHFSGHEIFTDYRRELNIEKAIATTTYISDGVHYKREVFASFDKRIMIVRLSSDKKNALTFSADFTTQHEKSKKWTQADSELVLAGTTSDHEGIPGKVKFESIAHLDLDGGSIAKTDTSLQITGANAVTIYISIASNFSNYKSLENDEKKLATQYLQQSIKQSFETSKDMHIKKYKSFFDRVSIDLGSSDHSNLPTDERLAAFKDNIDPEFVALYYQFGRYLLISSSQPGGQAANLQGIWNTRMKPPWDSKYTININAEMNYWPAEKTNLSEMHEPFLQLIRELSETGAKTAKTMYGARGWMAHHNTDIWRVSGAIDGAFWGMWTAGGGWLSQHLWEHYLYTGDKTYLEEIYPILKGAALFYVDFLVEDPRNGAMVVNPGNSPENAPKAHDGSSLDAGVTMDNQIVFDVFSSVIKAAEFLEKDEKIIDTLVQIRDKLPPMHIGKNSQLQEWLDDIDDPEDHHRHVSHLYGLYPSNLITPYATPKLFEASRNTLIQRGDISTGWSMGWKVNWWARLLDGDHAYTIIQNQLTPVSAGRRGSGGTYGNLFDAHPPFQIDGNFGCTSGITEMLMQSAGDYVHILPALPEVWPSGSIKGLKAKGGFEIVEIKWENYEISRLVVKSHLGGNLRLRLPNKLRSQENISINNVVGNNTNPFYYLNKIKEPIVSDQANLAVVLNKPTVLVDVATEIGKTITLIK